MFRTALDRWCRADCAYGVAAAYANIGSTHARWGNHLRDHRVTDQAQGQYRRAVEWLERCLKFSARARLGEDTSQAQGMLAEVHLELGDLDRAWAMATAAHEAAKRAGNELDLASATFILGKLHAVAGDAEQARVLLGEAKTRFEGLGRRERTKGIQHLPDSVST